MELLVNHATPLES